MKKIVFGKTQMEVSRIAFGGIPIQRVSAAEAAKVIQEALGLGINFIDTATGYTDSQEKIGLALHGVKRSSVVLASKSGVNDKKTMLEHIDNSLKMLKTDYVDIYQLHNVSTPEKMKAVMAEDGAYQGILQAVREGKVRFPGFSSHVMALAAKMITAGEFYSVQVPYNFIDRQAEEEVFPLARQHQMGILAMKPLGGGMLDNARLCFKYILQNEGVVPDPGIEKPGQMTEIAAIAEGDLRLSPTELEQIEKIRQELGDSWCHRCDYCQPCPQGISISTVLWVKSFMKRMTYQASSWVEKEMAQAGECQECRECVSRCPYQLDIPELLKKNRAVWDEYVAEHKGL